tara:strand:+ start:1489 stop:3774 length:2286 start_codon:yes stop_codon:yes gene_type:complete
MIPQNKLEQLADFQDAIQSEEGLERLRAMQYLQGINNQGLMGLPQVTQEPVIQRENGGITSPFKSNYGVRGHPVLDQFNPQYDLAGTTGNEMGLLKQQKVLEEQEIMQQQLESDPDVLENKIRAADIIVNGGTNAELKRAQEIYRNNPEEVQRYIDNIRMNPERAGGGQIVDTAQGLAGLGRYGDNMLVHMNPEEVAGLASLGTITYNPITGLPEAWGIKSFFKPFKQAAKAVKKVAKSKAFRTLAPLALTVAAPYLAAKFAPTWFLPSSLAKGLTLSQQVAAMSPWAMGISTGLGSGFGALIAGAKPKDALKAAAISGVTAGGLRGLRNYRDTGSLWKAPTQVPTENQLVVDAATGVDPAHGTTTFSEPSSYGQLKYSGGTGPAFGTYSTNPIPEIAGLPDTAADLYKAAGTDVMREPNWMQRQVAALGDTQLGQTVGQGMDYIADPQSVTGGIIEDYGTGTGLLELAAVDATIPDYRGDREREKELREAEEELRRRNYELTRPLTDEESGFNQTYVVVDPSGVEYNLTEDEILDIAYGRRARPRLTPRYTFNPTTYTKKGGLISLATGGMPEKDSTFNELSDIVKDLPDTPDISTEVANRNMIVLPDPPWSLLSSHGLNPADYMYMYTDQGTGKHYFKNIDTRKYVSFGSSSLKTGGTIEKAHGGEFSGMVPGEGHGMEDNVYMPIKDKGKQVGTLAVSPTEYVVDSYTMSALGNGNPDAGAKVMDGVVESVRKKAYGTIKQPNEINGLEALRPMMERV